MPAPTPSTRSELLARCELLLPPRRAESTIPGRSDSLEEQLLVVLTEDLGALALVDESVRRLMTTTTTFTLGAQSTILLSSPEFDDLDIEALHTAELYVTGIRGPASYTGDVFMLETGTPKPGIARWTISEGKVLVRASTAAATASKVCTLRDALITPYVDEADANQNTLHPLLEERVVNMVVARHLDALAAGAGAQAGGAA